MSDFRPPTPFNEAQRLRVLESLSILDSEPLPEFDNLAWLARMHFDVKSVLVSLIDAERQWFLASCGFDGGNETSREYAFCAHAIMKNDVLLVPDATADPVFRHNPFVTASPFIRFYAGMPIIIDGAPIGTVCLLSDQPRDDFGDECKQSLRAFSAIAEDTIKLRRYVREQKDSYEQKLREAKEWAGDGSNAKEQFLSLMSHELRTPLNAIIGFSDCIAEEVLGPVDPPDYKEFAEHIGTAGRRQLELIDRILHLADGQMIQIEDEELDLSDLLTKWVTKMNGDALIAGVRVDLRLPEAPVHLKGDLLHVRQIVLELIGNGIKFTPRGGEVWVEIGMDLAKCITLTVTDTGVGIAPDKLESVLSAFEQVSSGDTRRFEGAGVGLPIVKKLAELHGADLSISTPASGGTCAAVRFPAYRTLSGTVPHSNGGKGSDISP